MATVLISPLGGSKGLLFSAINLTKPDLAIILTSQEFAFAATEIFELTKQPQKKVLTMKDVFTGFEETERLVGEMQELCHHSDSIVINLTGGTTAMQWIMQSAYETLKNKNFKVKRVAFIDRRDSLEQKKVPFVIGELYEIDS